MKVVATKVGFFGKIREPGDEFEVPDGEKASWFEPVEKPARGKKAEAEKPAEDLA